MIRRRRTRDEERYYAASSWTLLRRNFFKHRLALAGGSVLLLFYLVGFLFTGFFSTYDTLRRFPDHSLAAPQRIRLFHDGRLRRPFVYGLEIARDPETYRRSYVEDGATLYPLRFFRPGAPYRLFGLFRSTLRFVSVDEPGTLFLFGTDRLGRDLFSRTLAGARVSLSIGLVGVALSFVIGCLLGGLSGYLGGPPDTLIQRLIEFLGALPTIPVWMALAAAVPSAWNPLATYFMMTSHSLRGGVDRAGAGGARQAAAAPGGGLRAGGEDRRRDRVAHHHAPSAAGLHELPHRPPHPCDTRA